MPFVRAALLPSIVFITGACVLVIEIVAFRVLSPYFGNTLFSVSSVLSVVLAGLSIGYYSGGRIADRFPESKWFFTLILAGGASVIALHLLGGMLLPAYGHAFSLSTGPLVMSFVLFFIPAVLLGTLSPYAVALQKLNSPESGVGSVAGTMFFWSTLGSIAGSLAAGFVLVPNFGVSRIMIGAGLVLLVIGFVGLAVYGRSRLAAGVGLVVLLFASGSLFQPESTDALYSRDGLYEKITIYDADYGGRSARFFVQDRSLSGAMFLDSDELVFDYTKYFALYKPFTRLERTLVIGGGAYSIPKAILADSPEARVDVAEIEPSLGDLAREYFRTPESPRLRTHVEDGRRFLAESGGEYDLIFSDVYYSFYSIPAHFTTKEFFTLARERLASDGVLVLNLIGSLAGSEHSLLLSELRTVQEVFNEMYVFAVDSPDSATPQNIIVVAVNRDSPASAEPDFSDILGLGDITERLVPLARYDLTRYPLLTDDFAPVEYLVGKMLSEEYSSMSTVSTVDSSWSGKRALEDIAAQLSFGSRARGTHGGARTAEFIRTSLRDAGLSVVEQPGVQTASGERHALTNIIGRYRPETERRIIIGTHYDAIARAYRDKEHPNEVMPGANNSASGVAVLLETARALVEAPQFPFGIDFVFFDGEEGVDSLGAGESKPWVPLGSTYFAEHLTDLYENHPEEAIIFDMVCDRDLQLNPESLSLNSARQNVEAFWELGSFVAPRSFLVSGPRRAIGDDHLPLIKAGIPSFLVIDFDYEPWYNTTEDTLDKCSAESLQAVGSTLMGYLRGR